MALTNFKVTDAGTALSADAAAHGIKVTLSSFKLGAGVGYVPDGTDTGLRGATLFTGSITSFSTSPDGALIATLVLNPDIGPFAFGEIGIYTDTGVLFASAALPNLQYKYSSLSSSVNSSIRLNCYLKVAQGPAIFQLPGAVGAEFYYVNNWAQVVPRASLSNPDTIGLIVNELASGGIQSLLLYSATDPTGWTLGHPFVEGIDAISITTSTSAGVTFTLPTGCSVMVASSPPYTAFGTWIVKCGAQYRAAVLTFPTATPVAGAVSAGAVGVLTFTEAVSTIMSGTFQLWTNHALGLVPPSPAVSAYAAGDIVMWPASSPRTGFLELNGAILSRTAYATLFAAIGTVGGAGDGVTTFKLPDMRGRFPRGWDHGYGLDPDYSRAIGSAQNDSLAYHGHPVYDPGHQHTYWNGNSAPMSIGDGAWIAAGTTPTSTSGAGTGISIGNGGTGTENRPKNLALMFCIKY